MKLKFLALAAILAGCVLNSYAAAPLKVTFVYSAPIGDAGWTFAHEKARKEVQAKFGDRIKTNYLENVNDGADSERVMRDAIGQGATMIVGTSFGQMSSMFKLTSEHSNVKFEHASGYKTGPNIRIYNSKIYEGFYLAGVIAGSMTKSRVLGFVAPMAIPEVIRNINSFTLGAQSVNPNISTKVIWVNEWFNPPKETEAANSLINAGADILMQNTASSAVPKTAEQRGKRGFGVYSDMKAAAPKAILGSAIINWTPYYTRAVQEMLDGTWKSGASSWGVKQDSVDLISLAPDVPAQTRAHLNQVKTGLKTGTFAIWKGPILDQQGKEMVARNAEASDGLLESMNAYVKGVEGKLPTK